MTSQPPTPEQQRRRQQADADYRAALERSRLNRRRWPAEVVALVEAAEARMARAVTAQRQHQMLRAD